MAIPACTPHLHLWSIHSSSTAFRLCGIQSDINISAATCANKQPSRHCSRNCCYVQALVQASANAENNHGMKQEHLYVGEL